jgi:hypothetical protein
VAPLRWIHAFRYVARQAFVAAQFGFAASGAAVREIAYGDLVGAAPALASLVALRARWSGPRPLVWAFAVATIVDLGDARRVGLAEQPFGSAHDVTLTILTLLRAGAVDQISTGLVTWLPLRSPGRCGARTAERTPS